eukprot:880181-Alexandrium_andersonii.AAC.1
MGAGTTTNAKRAPISMVIVTVRKGWPLAAASASLATRSAFHPAGIAFQRMGRCGPPKGQTPHAEAESCHSHT